MLAVTSASSAPFSMMPRTMRSMCVSGKASPRNWAHRGMPRNGKAKPDSRKLGRKKKNVICTAWSWFWATVENVGARAGDEVVQLYLKDLEASSVVPHHSLRGFERIHLRPGATREVAFELTARDLAMVDDAGRRVVEPGRFRASIGGSQPDDRSRELTGSSPVSVEFDVTAPSRT